MEGKSKRTGKVPGLCRHKVQKRGYITWEGRQILLPGHWPDELAAKPPEEIWLSYKNVLGRILTGEEPIPEAPGKITVAEICAAFLKDFAKDNSHHAWLTYRVAIEPLNRLYGHLAVESVGPLKFANLQTYLMDEPIKKRIRGASRLQVIDGKRRRIPGEIQILELPRKRTGVNRILKRLRFVWAWAVRKEMIPAWCLEGVKTVLAKRQRVGQDEKEILPVPDRDVLATLDHLPPVIQTMVRLQRLTGMRPGELVLLQTGAIDRTDRLCWWYHPKKHKNAWRGRKRAIPLGLPAIELLLPWLKADPDKYLFSPAERIRQWLDEIRKSRKTPVQPSQIDRSKSEPSRKPGECYTPGSYARAIKAGCLKAGVPTWSPNQLRKAAADEILNSCDLEHARALLGHAHPEITKRHYAVRDRTKAREAANRLTDLKKRVDGCTPSL